VAQRDGALLGGASPPDAVRVSSAGDAVTTRYSVLETPIGEFVLRGDSGGTLSSAFFVDGMKAMTPQADWRRDDAAFKVAREQLAAYFAGELTTFDIHLHPHGTVFQRRVWDAVSGIPYGATSTYGRLATHIGEPTAFRAVGAANGRNPLPILIPCHRLIGADGGLTGYGGGMHRKQWLLALEARR
jgi:methylated-DNA-[protein]-cysteine S-methyltransferase